MGNKLSTNSIKLLKIELEDYELSHTSITPNTSDNFKGIIIQ